MLGRHALLRQRAITSLAANPDIFRQFMAIHGGYATAPEDFGHGSTDELGISIGLNGERLINAHLRLEVGWRKCNRNFGDRAAALSHSNTSTAANRCTKRCEGNLAFR